MGLTEIIIIATIILILGILCKPIRKALGVLLIILGIIECMSITFVLIGIPSIFIGAILLFVGGEK